MRRLLLLGLLVLASLWAKAGVYAQVPNADVLQRLECTRCHQVSGVKPPPIEKSCIGCHQAIKKGDYDSQYGFFRTRKWRSNIQHLVEAPPLSSISRRLARSWVEEYLKNPHIVRPQLGASMPRLRLSDQDIREVLDALYSGDKQSAPEIQGPRQLPQNTPSTEPLLLSSRGCLGCHSIEDASLENYVTWRDWNSLPLAVRMAPHLGLTKVRMQREQVRAWLKDPQSIQPGTLMPHPHLSEGEQESIVQEIFSLATKIPQARTASPVAPLSRKVTFDEVSSRVLKRICWHCHSDPSGNKGDGGPGNTGGFGYAGAGLDLGTYEGIMRGARGKDGLTRSVLAGTAESPGVPLIVQHLLARRNEVAGEAPSATLGMPLGLPPLPDEEIALLWAWINQGAPR
jgi:hypothetical protein